MAGLIVKSPYLKCGEDHSVSGYLHYIGTRERVELLPDDRPPTRKQEQFITKLVKYFPNVKIVIIIPTYPIKRKCFCGISIFAGLLGLFFGE